MARPAEAKSIDSQITSYVNSLSEKNKQAVLIVVKTMAEAEHEAAFERKWAEGISLEESRENLLAFVRSLKWDKKK